MSTASLEMRTIEGSGISINRIRYGLQIFAFREPTIAILINVNDVMTSQITFPCPGFGEVTLVEWLLFLTYSL